MKRHALLLAACTLAAFNAPLAAKPVEQVRVGFSTSISGPFAALGAEARDGFNLAIKQLGGKLGGIPMEVFATDEAGNPDTARQHVDRYLKRDRIHFYTGPIGSNVALAVGPTLFAAEVFYLSNNAGPSQLAGEKCNAYFFGTAWQNDAYHEAAGKFASERGFKKVAVLAPNYPAGQDAITGFKRGYAKPVSSETFTKLGQLDYAAELANLRKRRMPLHLSARRHGDQFRQAVRRRGALNEHADRRAGFLGRRGRDSRCR
jgi:branched-chain amino acid transport system substrate-binding protein